MFCTNCGSWNGDQEGLCINCMTETPTVIKTNENRSVETKLIGEISGIEKKREIQEFSEKRANGKYSVIFAVVATLLFCGLIGAVLFTALATGFIKIDGVEIGSRKTEPPVKTQPANLPANSQSSVQTKPKNVNPPKPRPTEAPAVENPQNFNDAPAQKPQILIDETFHVPASSFKEFRVTITRPTRFAGVFSAQGGSNDIQCFLVDDFEIQNLRNKTNFRAIYQSGIVSQGRIDNTLPVGTYYLVFSNMQALMTNKTVTAKFMTE